MFGFLPYNLVNALGISKELPNVFVRALAINLAYFSLCFFFSYKVLGFSLEILFNAY